MKTIERYLADAAKIITVSKLGFKIDCISLAKEVLQTKIMPDNALLGVFDKAGTDAHNIIASNEEKIDEANQMALSILSEYGII